ncbi:Hypothetical protein Cp1002B_0979 [Corynebacterium pseudotuberculosis]|nr:Hypothetical protein CpPAT10_1673 [Corynebacterium pseudotuberculosis PAT10]AFF22824.1 Hypothetical protein CpP54B96_1700 [Corynebacterium pseudotuberculosis P54B96]AFH52623.1 Hypothetical protein Cp267_1739 [Corynebacterium pseudotuberculosis 267]AJC14407.1 Hypothetical protein CpVD57_1705 [Corynebacterium pseudotuberculosis]AKJ56350.1 Hypothetical protein Cp12C_1762 [Corynebacterium pseudotuberculosis]
MLPHRMAYPKLILGNRLSWPLKKCGLYHLLAFHFTFSSISPLDKISIIKLGNPTRKIPVMLG